MAYVSFQFAVPDTEEPPPAAAIDRGSVLDAACKTMRDLVNNLVDYTLTGQGTTSGSFYDLGRGTMNHMIKLITLAKKLGMSDEEHRLKLLLFQVLSIAKSCCSSYSFYGVLAEKVSLNILRLLLLFIVLPQQVKELDTVRVQLDESLWWFSRMAKLRMKYISVVQDYELSEKEGKLYFSFR